MPRPTRCQAGSCVMSMPSASTDPFQAGSRPAAALITVDLPAPLEPMIVVISRSGKRIDAFLTTATSP